ncbi:MAG: twin-arginine translocation signal domain-containing protein [Gammaproteobacteria bacterium]
MQYKDWRQRLLNTPSNYHVNSRRRFVQGLAAGGVLGAMPLGQLAYGQGASSGNSDVPVLRVTFPLS